MHTDIKTIMQQYPDNWWRNYNVVYRLKDNYDKCLLGLLVSVLIDGNHQDYIYSGIGHIYRGYCLWMTTGHSIDNIKGVLTNSELHINTMTWVDRCNIAGAESFRVHDKNIDYHRADKLDFGYSIMNRLDFEALNQNENFIFMSEKAWLNINDDNPEGYYLVGYPNEWKNVDRQQISEYQYSTQLRSTIAYLPITKIEYSNKTQDKYSLDDPDAFYGKIVDYIGNDGPMPLNIEGMSGGPLFSVESDYKTEEIKFRLAGIQRGWKKSGRIIVVEPIQRIAAYLEEEFSLESS